MSNRPSGSVLFSGRAGRNVGTCNSVLLFALAVLTVGTGTCAFALTPTATTLAVTSAGSKVTTVPGQAVITLTATVEAGTTPLTVGQVNFCDATVAACTDIHLLGTAQLTSAGTAIFKFIPGVGSHSYKAVFLGTRSDAASSSTASPLTVTSTHFGKYSTTTTIAQSGVAGNYTLTATVAALTDSAEHSIPTGTVSFLDTTDGNAVLGTAELGGSANGLSFFNSSNFALPFIPQCQPPENGSDPVAVAVADFNGDGILDLAVAAPCITAFLPIDSSVIIYLGDGDGTFTYKSAPDAGPNLSREAVIAVADLDGDGIPDIVVSGDTVKVLLGNGDGTFRNGSSLNLPRSSTLLGTGDFNGDGIPDLAVFGGGSMFALLGNGDGTFAAAPTSTPLTGVFLNASAVGDFNGDGILDLAITNDADRKMLVFLGNGDGTFTQVTSEAAVEVDPASMTVGDFNGDGKLDIAVANEYGLDQFPWLDTITILLGNGDGTFTAAPTLTTPPQSYPSTVAVGDFNGDGIPDLAVAETQNVVIFTGNGDGTFTQAASPSPGVALHSLALGDFNGDGRPDLVAPLGNTLTAVLLTETQTATATATGISPDGTGTRQVAASFPGDGNYSASLSGTIGLTAANVEASFSTSSLSFGSQDVGYTTSSQNVILTNSGTEAMTIRSIKLTGADTSSFATSNTCGSILAAGAKCKIGVRFVPESTGPFTASITLTDNAPGSPQTISLSGTGIIVPAASLSLSATSLFFPDVPAGVGSAGYSSATQNVTVTNTSGTTVYFNSIRLGGADPLSFVTSNTCGGSGSVGGTLAAGATCRVGVRFTPQTGGPLSATITLTDNAGASPQAITLNGTGIGALAMLSANSVPFGNEPLGDSTDSQNVTLLNNGYLPLDISSIRLTGANVSSFATSNTCGLGLAPGDRCTIGVRFVPGALGAASANITLTDNAPASPQNIALSGTGITPPPATLSLSTTSLAFGNQAVGLSTVAQNVTITNTSSTTTLYFKTITLGGANASSFVTSNTCNGPTGNGIGGSLAPGAECRIGARFVPKATGPLAATITLTDSATGSPQTISLTGTGQ